MLAQNKFFKDELCTDGEYYRNFYEEAPICFQSTDENRCITQVNSMWLKTYGYKYNEVYGECLDDFVDIGSVKDLSEFYKTLSGTEDVVTGVLKVVKKDDSKILANITAKGIKDEKGNLITVHYTFINAPEEKLLKQTPQKMQRELLQQVVEFAPTAIIIYVQGVIIFGNLAAAKLLSLESMDELIGRDFLDFVHPEYRQNYINDIAGGRCSEFIEEKYVCTDGRVIEVETVLVPFNYEGNTAIYAVIRDNTERKKMAEELKKASKLEGISLFAGKISHDFNNILAIILGNVSLSKISEKQSSKMYQRLDDIEQAVYRAKDLTNRLQTFAKGGEPIRKVTCISKVINKVISSISTDHGVEFIYSFSKGLFLTKVDEGQMGQVFEHLIENAYQAMPEGGKIFISAENIVIDKDSVTPAPLPQGKHVKITIKDQGIGIPEDIKNKIFDPFFTTKQNGTGLGLSICFSILRQHDGLISMKSEEGLGTTFFMFLPALEGDPGVLMKKEEKLIQGEGKVLVMDDEDSIREIAGEMLRYLGYRPGFARDGREAIRKYKEAKLSKNPFDVVIMDLTIPCGMGGEKAIKKLRSLDPDVKAIVSSGYYNDPVISNYIEYGFDGMVSKPYKMEALSKELEKVLSKKYSVRDDFI
ncbi:PAS domain-containing hybrid sensor histidine kinase/response regulator [Candidatus Contubernalis alkaliaceticus]|uniref:PAS domain-containing hybrid sensor histidine kinase/response regulator n=1 Tax=Candidatus Contubernalis alkaliaceticus TaxID=338645 RepID=UPI001F4C2123|nr:ATP-binding protein [Candidatus Contubernalis alkalaceticus]UNC90643.1 PAS domain S-box protein [Candidatus Contubernalis alkalaceticus]